MPHTGPEQAGTGPDTGAALPASSPAMEQAAQSLWRLRPAFARAPWFDALLHNEFLGPEQQVAAQRQALREMLGFCIHQVPYYRDLCKREGITPDVLLAPDGHLRLPVLTRNVIQTEPHLLQPARLPGDMRIAGTTKTSGTTGEPVTVPHTQYSMGMFGILAQREVRWFRIDPSLTFAQIRPEVDLPPMHDGSRIRPGQTVTRAAWPLLGKYFETGPFIGFSNNNPVDAQLQWLAEHQPDYLLSLSADLEHLALAYDGGGGLSSIRACKVISQQMTASMRRIIDNALHVPVHEDYGMNEIGLVAVRCPEGGRYHVHAENCFVEIVDEEGQPCRPGERGRLLVTGLSNPAMPLLRYDVDDLAEPAEGPCPCGRTLPSFAAIHGRYRRTAYLPEGTWGYWNCLLDIFGEMEPALLAHLRQYQLHQYLDGHFELKLVTTGAAGRMIEKIEAGWNASAANGTPAALVITRVTDIPRPRGGKFQNFISDFTPPEDTAKQS